MTRRIGCGVILLLLSFALWIPASDVIKLIVQQDPVLLGRYSRGHFAAAFLVTLLLWLGAWIGLARQPLREAVMSAVTMLLSTVLTVFLALVATGWILKPRYVESAVQVDDAALGVALSGIVRHRPPNESYDTQFVDVPEQKRSYPNAPLGHPEVKIKLTSDRNGFRNQDVADRYPIVAVGDSFTAGSHVSDDQAWTVLLSHALNTPVYNLGVGGTAPQVYLNNYVALGRSLHPKTVLFMVYEGNDFRYSGSPESAEEGEHASVEPSLGEKITQLILASPITQGLRRFVDESLANINTDAPLLHYADTVGFMPVALTTGSKTNFYTFAPKRMVYLYRTPEEFRGDWDWKGAEEAFLKMKTVAVKDGVRLVMIYAPSAPHVVMPLVADKVPAEQLWNFARFKKKSLPEPDTFKREFFATIESQERVFMTFCQEQNIECVSTTQALRDATAQGIQTYYTYDQHWTPEGNRVVATLLNDYLQKHSQQ